MATYQFSALTDGQSISFNPSADLLNFDQTVIAAADIRAVAEGANLRISVVSGANTGKDVLLLNVTPLQLAISNITFADGSRLLFGDTVATTTADNSANNIAGTAGRDHLNGLGGNDTLGGGAGSDLIVGGAGNDSLGGGSDGADTLEGGLGNDILAGGGGQDTFVFREVGAANADTLNDMSTNWDRIQLDASAMTALGANGQFAAGDARFAANATGTAQDASDRIIFNTSTGQIFYDADGNGAGTAQLLATQTGGRTVAAADFTVIGATPPPAAGINGGPGNDALRGTSGNDSINGFGGDDTIEGFGGNDTVDGGTGFDLLRFEWASTAVVVNFNTGTATGGGSGGSGSVAFTNIEWVEGSRFNDLITANNAGVRIYANAGSDTIVGGAGADVLYDDAHAGENPQLQGGNDQISGGGGNDTVVITIGNDSADAGTGNDQVSLNVSETLNYGNDVINGGDGTDTLAVFLAGDVVIDLETGTMTGGSSNAADGASLSNIENVSTAFVVEDGSRYHADIRGTSAANVLSGELGDDTIQGSYGNDTLSGGAGNDSLVGGQGFDLLVGGSGNDTLNGFHMETFGQSETEVDTLNGGLGDDHYYIDNAGDVLSEAGGIDTLHVGDMGWTLGADFENLVLHNDVSEAAFTGVGNALANFMSISYAASRLEGRGGNDTLVGSGFADHLIGDDGNDSLGGGGGDWGDTLDGGAGNDTLDASGFLVFSVAPGAANADLLTGFNSGIDVIRLNGSVHANSGVSGRFAADDGRFVAGAGANAGQDASDRVIYNTSSGQLWYDADGSGAGASQLIATLQGAPTLAATDIEVIGGGGPMTINGTAGNDSLVGGEGNDTINGLAGNDTLIGNGGNDSLDGGIGTDSMDGGLGNDTYVAGTGDVLSDAGGVDTVVTDVTWSLGQDFENLTMTGTGNITMQGNTFNNLIIGNAGNNTFNARAGDDTILAGAGNDRIDMFGNGFASYGNEVVDGGAGIDTMDFSGYAKSAIVVNLAAGTVAGGGDFGSGTVAVSNVERVVTGAFNDRLTGNTAANTLEGRAGNDTLSGGTGNDTLIGGTGADFFLFETAPSTSNVERITDFVSASDKLQFENGVFTAIGAAGNFAAGDGRFWAAAGATAGHDANDRVVYNTSTGSLYYDADGSGSGAAQLIATFQGNPAIAATDITVI